jgi:hypothetical protein
MLEVIRRDRAGDADLNGRIGRRCRDVAGGADPLHGPDAERLAVSGHQLLTPGLPFALATSASQLLSIEDTPQIEPSSASLE